LPHQQPKQYLDNRKIYILIKGENSRQKRCAMADEISKTTIVVLIILTILISIIGTITVISAVGDSQAGMAMKAPPSANRGEATISLTIEAPQAPPTGQAVISLNIAKK
jgi:hypothetical protein